MPIHPDVVTQELRKQEQQKELAKKNEHTNSRWPELDKKDGSKNQDSNLLKANLPDRNEILRPKE